MCEDADGREGTRGDARGREETRCGVVWRLRDARGREREAPETQTDARGRKLDAEGRDRGREGDAIGRALGREGTHTQTHCWYKEAHTGPYPCISTIFNIE